MENKLIFSKQGLAYRRFGLGQPLLCLHGFLGSAIDWYPMADRLKEHFDLLLIDLPLSGNSKNYFPSDFDLDYACMGRSILEIGRAHV